MPMHQAVHVSAPGGSLELVKVDTTPPPRGHVRIAVGACGICGTDHTFVHNGFPGISWPLTPGHEIAGTIAELGEGVEGFAVGGVVTANFTVGDGHIADLALLAVLHELRKGDFPVMTHARALLDDLP